MCMYSERKFSKDRVIPKGYVELLENRVEILETGLREALLRLNANGGFHLHHSSASNPSSPASTNFLDNSHDLNYNITQALRELQAMKVEREKSVYSDHSHDDHSDHGESAFRSDSAELTDPMSSAKTEDLATPLTSPSNSPPPKALFFASDFSQPLSPQFTESNINFYQSYYDRQTPNSVLNLPSTGPFLYDDPSLSWLDSVALNDNYNISLQNNDDFSLII
jgi:hypothetical protein